MFCLSFAPGLLPSATCLFLLPSMVGSCCICPNLSTSGTLTSRCEPTSTPQNPEFFKISQNSLSHFSQIFSNFLKFLFLKFSQIFSNFLKNIFENFLKIVLAAEIRILRKFSQIFSQIFSNFLKFSQIFSKVVFLKISQNFSNFLKFSNFLNFWVGGWVRV